MDVAVTILVIALASIAGWNIESNKPLAFGLLGIATLVLLFWGAFRWFQIGQERAKVSPQFQMPTEPIPVPEAAVDVATKATEKRNETETPQVKLPERVDGAPLLYQYKGVNAELLNKEVFYQAAEKGLWELTPKKIDGAYHLFLLNTDAAILRDKKKEEMLDDWIRRGDPYKALLNKLTAEGNLTIFLAFYRDRRKGQEWREQSVVTLTGYKSEEVQDYLFGYEQGEPLELEESHEKEGRIDVVKNGFRLGSLPAKIAKRCEDADPYGIFVESIDLDDDGEYYVPTVRLFW